MASRQFKEDRAEAAAKLAAKEVGEINRARERDQGLKLGTEREFKEARAEVAAKLAAKDLEDANLLREREIGMGHNQQEQQGPSLIGSMFNAVKHAKDAVVGKTQEAAHATSDYTSSAAQKAKDAKDTTVDKAAEYTGYAADKAREAKDYTADKVKQGKDTTVDTLGNVKDKTMGLFSGDRDDDEPNYHTNQMAKEKLEELRLRGRDRPSPRADDQSERGRGATSNILGAMGSVKEAIKSKLTSSPDVVERGEKVVIEVEESRPGAVADTLKAADQMSAQAFNDPDRFVDQGTIRVERRKNM